MAKKTAKKGSIIDDEVKAAFEKLIDKTSLKEFVLALADIAQAKGEYIRETYGRKDAVNANAWKKDAAKLKTVASRIVN